MKEEYKTTTKTKDENKYAEFRDPAVIFIAPGLDRHREVRTIWNSNSVMLPVYSP